MASLATVQSSSPCVFEVNADRLAPAKDRMSDLPVYTASRWSMQCSLPGLLQCTYSMHHLLSCWCTPAVHQQVETGQQGKLPVDDAAAQGKNQCWLPC